MSHKTLIKNWRAILLLFVSMVADSNEQLLSPQMSHPSGFYDKDTMIKVEVPKESYGIYTLDGYQPLFDLGKSHKFLANKTFRIIDGPLVIRAQGFYKKSPSTKEIGQIFFPKSINRSNAYILSLIISPNELWNPERGLFNDSNLNESTNYKKGKEWEKEAFITIFDTNGDILLEQKAGIRLGGYEFGRRRSPQKPLQFFARKRYGFPFFSANIFPQRGHNKYKRFIIRNSHLLNDILVHELSKNLKVDVSHSQPVEVYINGQYWGMYQLKEKMDQHFFARVHAVPKGSIELLKLLDVPIYGDNKEWLVLNRLIMEGNPLDNELYYKISQQFDIDSFIDYLIVQTYFENADWPGNNEKYWRSKSGKDKRWKWAITDLDEGFYDQNPNVFLRLLKSIDRDKGITKRYRYFLENPKFREKFSQRLIHVMKHDFHPSKTLPILEKLYKLYKPLMAKHQKRWKIFFSFDQHKTRLENYLKNRPCQLKKDYKEAFGQELMFNCKGLLAQVGQK